MCKHFTLPTQSSYTQITFTAHKQVPGQTWRHILIVLKTLSENAKKQTIGSVFLNMAVNMAASQIGQPAVYRLSNFKPTTQFESSSHVSVLNVN